MFIVICFDCFLAPLGAAYNQNKYTAPSGGQETKSSSSGYKYVAPSGAKKLDELRARFKHLKIFNLTFDFN